MKIGTLAFGRDELTYGLEQVVAPLRSRHEVARIDTSTFSWPDVLFVSIYWWEHVWAYHDFLLRVGWKPGMRPRIVVGGFNTANPWPFHGWADAIHVGDGEECGETLLAGDCPHVFREQPLLWHNAPLRPFMFPSGGIARIEIARGCRHACRFCQVAWQKSYREADPRAVRECIRDAARSGLKRVALFAPEPFLCAHERDYEIECRLRGLSRVDSDMRWDSASRVRVSVPRLGIEGLSERLRKACGKPITDDQIVDIVARHLRAGRRRLFFYIILDLPGEDGSDYEAFHALLCRLQELPGAVEQQLNLCPSPNVFMPAPHTPWENEAIHPERDYRKVWAALFRRGHGRKDWIVPIAERTRIYAPESRILSMIATRCGPEGPDIMRKLLRSGCVRVSGGRIAAIEKGRLYREVDHERYTGRIEKGPWKIVTTRRSGAAGP